MYWMGHTVYYIYFSVSCSSTPSTVRVLVSFPTSISGSGGRSLTSNSWPNVKLRADGCCYRVAIFSTLWMTVSVMGSSIHIKRCSISPVTSKRIFYPPPACLQMDLDRPPLKCVHILSSVVWCTCVLVHMHQNLAFSVLKSL